MTLHKDLTGADLHEPKGVSTATSGQVYQANGAGSGTWSSLVIPTGLFNITTSVFTSSGTWTKPTGMFMARVTVIGGGCSMLGTGAADGGTSSFGTYCIATGGSHLGTPGTGTVGDILLDGSYQTTLTGGASTLGVPGATTNPCAMGSPGLKIGKYGYGDFSTGSGTQQACGGAAIKYLYSTTGTVTVTVGSQGGSTTNAQPGVVIIEQFISV